MKAKLKIFINNFLLFTFAGLTQALLEVLDGFRCEAERGRPLPPGINMVLRLPLIKLTMYLFFIWRLYLMILMGANPLHGPSGGDQWSLKILTLSQNATRFACCHFRAQKSLDFQGLLHELINYKDTKP
jgi:hypothetical protein